MTKTGLLLSAYPEVEKVRFARASTKPQKAKQIVRVDGMLFIELENGSVVTGSDRPNYFRGAYIMTNEHMVRPVMAGLVKLGLLPQSVADKHEANSKAIDDRKCAKYAAAELERISKRHGVKLGRQIEELKRKAKE